MTRALVVVALVASLAACGGDPLDTASLPVAADWGQWAYHDQHGFVPGHGDSWRSIFINPIGRGYTGVGPYPEGTVLVKEIRHLRTVDGQPAPGGLRYVAIMRKVNDPPPGVTTDRGWIFSTRSTVEPGEETQSDLCWATCHRQAPIDGAFYDYGKVGTDP